LVPRKAPPKMKNLCMILLGAAIAFGNVPSRQFFLMTLNYLVYIVCGMSLYALHYLAGFFENKQLYEDVTTIFTMMPTSIVWHFISYPEAYCFCGVILILLGMTAMRT